jgi:aquaporin Z
MFAGPITGASMNPARSIAPAVISGNTSSLWIYILAPILGAVLASLTWKFMKEEQ